MTDHMLKSYERDLGDLTGKVLQMGEAAGHMVADGVQCLFERDAGLAVRTAREDHAVNDLDLEIERLCIDMLARYQPVAVDLRAITTALKVATDLERVGDEAVNISEQAAELRQQQDTGDFFSLPEMAETAQQMFRHAMAAYGRRDADLARTVCEGDSLADELHAETVRRLFDLAAEGGVQCGTATRLMFVCKYLERIADHATNIAEMVIYRENGNVIRHGMAHSKEP